MNLTNIFAATALTISSLVIFHHNADKPKSMPGVTEGETLTITSSAFKEGAMIPKKYTCQGSNFNPPLHIDGIPADAKSITIIMEDPDAPVAGGFTHWLGWNFDQTMIDIPEAYKGGMQGNNSAKKKGYMGPCPPDGTHHYHFHVYALSERLSILATSDKDKVRKAMEGKILAEGDLMGLFTKGGKK